MVADAPIPPDEEARLDALYDYAILDTPPDHRFDLFPKLCSWVFDVPLAAINLVDAERTFFKSVIGFEAYAPRRVTSICAHAVGEGAPVMVIEDLTRDHRFEDHPLVANGMAFYAGALLRSESGHALGTLCIGDTRSRHFRTEDRSKLLELAYGVSAVLELHRTSNMLRQLADQDMLTGLYTRRAFMRSLDDAVAAAKMGQHCALLYLDLDCFKVVNDTYGHAAGDAMLREAGRRLENTARVLDKVSRLGGDEFAILIDDHGTIATAETLARRILSSFMEPFTFDGIALAIRTSIGIAVIDDRVPQADAETLMRCADEALYTAKRAGRSQFAVFGQS